jgi:oxygen-independent coproporphyrinogen-3 oxidase
MTSPAHSTLPVSLYIHVPFCVSKCAYCDFTSQTLAEAERGSRFVDAVLSTLDRAVARVVRDVPTVYFGGGTPTILGEELVRLVEGVRERAGVRPDAEITVETNPETTDPGLIEALVATGVNRFSLGVQSFDDAVLRTLGRAHDAARAAEACSTLSKAGVPFSIDLMCGVPGQTIESWSETLERAAATGALHYSVYPLSIEEGTPFFEAVAHGRLSRPSQDLAADMMLMARDSMAYHAMDRYEVANYAYPGYESRHNLVYWTGGAYVGIGPSAASMLPAEATLLLEPRSIWGPTQIEWLVEEPRAPRARFTMNETLSDFVHGGWDRMPAELEWLELSEMIREDMMLGLRLTEGVAVERFVCARLHDVMVGLADKGLAERFRSGDGEERWRTTDRGWLLGNEVFGAVWAGE